MKYPIFFLNKTNMVLGTVVIGAVFSFVIFLVLPPISHGNEIEQIKATKEIERQIPLYTKLIERVGPEQAQEDLYHSGLPFTGQTHLLNHTVGDYLYLNYGPSGLLQCKDYFLSSCYHGFVLHTIAKGGMSEVVKTLEECRKQSNQTLAQCSHAIGHGYLAYLGYKNLIEALKDCDQTKEQTPYFPLYSCYDGVFMENIWGLHDGKPSPDRWVRPDDLHYPCDDPRIEEKYLLGCWSNQPVLVYQLLNRDIAKVPAVCLQVKNPEHRKMCFDGLARQIHPLAGGNIDTLFELCGLMPDSGWTNFCLSVNAASSFGMGDREKPYKICGRIAQSSKKDCYTRIFGNMSVYIKNREEFYGLCEKVTEVGWRKQCVDMPFGNL